MIEALFTIVGGTIAGAAGLLSSWLQFNWQAERERRRWHNRRNALVRRLTSFGLAPMNADDLKKEWEHRAFQRRALTTTELLEDHLANAPIEIPPGAWSDFDELRESVERLQSRSTGDIDDARILLNTARDVARDAEEFESNFEQV
jgi:hypothetical protein